MAKDPVYDDEEAEKPGAGSVPSADEQSEPDTDNLADAEDEESEGSEQSPAKKKRKPITPWGKSIAEDEEEAAELRKSIGDEFSSDLEDDEAEDTGFYTGEGDKRGTGKLRRSGTLFGRFRKNRWVLGGLGAGLVGIIMGGIALFNFLNFFKLEHLLNNIDQRSFARINAVFDARSDKWMRAYITLRLSEMNGTLSKGPDDNLWIKANKVDTNKPLTDWYRTMRTNRFEERLLNKHGIYFASTITPDGTSGFSTIKVGPREVQAKLEAGGTKFKDMNVVQQQNFLRQIDGLVEELYKDSDSSIQMRGALRKAIKDETHFWQVIKKRHMRKWIQNKIGLSDWKFFEKTRNKISTKKSEVQRKILRKIIPKETKSGKFILCVFAAGPCPLNTDSNNPGNKVSSGFNGKGSESEGDKPITDDSGNVDVNDDGDVINGEVGSNAEASSAVDEGLDKAEKKLAEGALDNLGDDAANAVVRAEIINAIMSKVNIAVATFSVVKTMDTLSRIDHNIVDTHALSKLAVLAKTGEAVSTYTTAAIQRDQAHTGELTADEYNVVMQDYAGAENSEAYDYIFDQNPNVANAATSKEEACKSTAEPKRTDYFWNCAITQIGGETNGKRIEDAYLNSAGGKVMHEVISAYRDVRNQPGIKQLFDFAGWLGGWISDRIGDGFNTLILNPALKLLHLEDDIKNFMVWLTTEMMRFLGAGPIQAGVGDHPGLRLTMVVQGAAAVAEGSMRGAGAGISNPTSKAYTDQLTQAYLDEQEANQSLSQRYLAVSNPDSVAAKSMYSLSNISVKKVGSIGKWFGNALQNLGSVFSRPAKAQSVSGTAAFAGIDSFDFPQECIAMEPLASPSADQYTNADELVNKDGKPFLDRSAINMDLLTNADAFWAKVYERVGDNDFDPGEVQKVYNCETLEQQVRSGLGFVNNYTDDNGLNSGLVYISGSGPAAANIDCSTITGNEKIICAAKNFLGVRYANRNEGTGAKWLNEWGVSQIDGSLGQSPQQWIAERVVGGANDFMECSGFTKTAIFAAYGVTVNAACSAAYRTDTQYFKEIDLSEIRPGDLLIESTVCGNGGHIAIYLGMTDTGMLSTLESSAGKNVNGLKRSGYYEHAPGSLYKYAVRYIGPGSSP